MNDEHAAVEGERDSAPAEEDRGVEANDAVAKRRAASLKERVYVAFATLAVVIALRSHDTSLSAAEASTTLLVTIGGTVLAVLLADLLSHLMIHTALPSRQQWRDMVTVSMGAVAVAIPPLASLALAGLGLWTTATALAIAMSVLLAALITIGFLAIHHLPLPTRQKILILAGETSLAIAVIALELLAHA